MYVCVEYKRLNTYVYKYQQLATLHMFVIKYYIIICTYTYIYIHIPLVIIRVKSARCHACVRVCVCVSEGSPG